MRRIGSRTRLGWRAAVLVFAVLATYANTLEGPFIFDDIAAIVDNTAIRDLRSRAVVAAEREVPVAGRPVVNLSLALNYAGGGLRVRGYHLTNIVLHALCALVLFAVLQLTLAQTAFGEFVNSRALDLSFSAALLWAVHPLNSEVVDYTTQRTESLMALCYLSTLGAAILAFDENRGGRWTTVAILSCVIGMGCKESMVTAPVMVALFDRVFFSRSFREAWTRRWALYAGLAATWLVLVVVTWSGPRIHSAGFSAGVAPWTYLLNQSTMIVRYLRLAVWPAALVLHYGEPAPLTLADVWPASILVVTLLGAAAWALIRRPAWGFWGAWFFVTLAPTSSILPIATEVGAERRMYLPLVALITLFVMGAAHAGRLALLSLTAAKSTARAPLVSAAVVIIVSTALATRTVARNRDYRSSVVMAQTVSDRWPTPVAQGMLGVSLEAEKRHEEALVHLRASANGGYSRAHFHLGGALFNYGDVDGAIPELESFLRQSPELAEAVSARMLLGRAYIDKHRFGDAAAQLRQVLTMRPSNLDALGLLADSVFGQQQFQESVALYSAYVASRPTDVGALINLGVAYAGLGRPKDAEAAFQMGLQVAPHDVRIYRNLAALALNTSDAAAGTRAAQRAVALDDDDAVAHDLLGRALAMQGQIAEARHEFERALAIDPAFNQARADLAVVGGR
jgi:tetratricopeptide (TPR) repeat protein